VKKVAWFGWFGCFSVGLDDTLEKTFFAFWVGVYERLNTLTCRETLFIGVWRNRR